MMKKFSAIFPLLAALLFCLGASAQLPDCTLGIGGKDAEVLTKVFQLNEAQINSMEVWMGELQTQNKLVEDEIKTLFDTHPQSNQEELENLARKYKALQDKMVATNKSYDRKLLGLFNPKQYERYVALCNEALRRPLSPLRVVKADTLAVKPE